jgi:hypothetical protein
MPSHTHKTYTFAVRLTKVGVPKDVKLMSSQNYGVDGVLQYFMAKFEDISAYPSLDDGMLQAFREAGNIICFVSLLDQVLAQMRAQNTFHLAPICAMDSAGQNPLTVAIRGAGGRAAELLAEQATRTCAALIKHGSLLQVLTCFFPLSVHLYVFAGVSVCV